MKTQIEQTKKIAVKAKGIKIMICKESKLFWELGFNLQAFSSSQKSLFQNFKRFKNKQPNGPEFNSRSIRSNETRKTFFKEAKVR